jgi:hypothetical protein
MSLSINESQSILKVLLFLSKVDGEFSDSEYKMIADLKNALDCKEFDLEKELISLPINLNDIGEILKDLQTREAKEYLIKIIIHFCYCDGAYTASERLTLYHIGSGLGESKEFIFQVERDYAYEAQAAIIKFAQEHSEALGNQPKNFSWRKAAKITGLTLVGGVALAATGGMAAPVIGGIIGSTLFGLTGAAATSAGLAALGGGAIAAGGGGMAAGGVVVTSLLGLGGVGLGAKTGLNLFGDLEEFEFVPLTPNRYACHQLLCIHGFMQQKENLEETWQFVVDFDLYSDIHGLRWESKTLTNWLDMLQQASFKVGAGNLAALLASTATKAAGGLIALPVAIASAFSLIDNPWHVARNKAELAGKELAKRILSMPSPISLVGYSLGSRVIAYALEHLEKEECYGKVFDVYFMGGAVGKKHEIFRSNKLEKLVVNNTYNFYSKKDLVLTYLYQSAEFGDKPIGLMPIESQRVINIDVTSIIDDHLQYPFKIDILLRLCVDQQVQQSTHNPNQQSPTEKIIKILQTLKGMTSADPHDISKAEYFCTLSDGSVILIFKNNFNVHHVFVASKKGSVIFSGFVGWIHTNGLYESLKSIQNF